MIKAKLKSTGQPVIIVDSFEDGKYKVTFEDNPAVSKYVRPSELEINLNEDMKQNKNAYLKI